MINNLNKKYIRNFPHSSIRLNNRSNIFQSFFIRLKHSFGTTLQLQFFLFIQQSLLFLNLGNQGITQPQTPLLLHSFLIPTIFLIIIPCTSLQDFFDLSIFNFIGLDELLDWLIMLSTFFLPFWQLRQRDIRHLMNLKLRMPTLLTNHCRFFPTHSL